MAWTFTKNWTSDDDGSTFSGSDIQNIQTDISSQACDLASTQTISGDKTFSGALRVTGTFDISGSYLAGVVTYENAVVSNDGEVVHYI